METVAFMLFSYYRMYEDLKRKLSRLQTDYEARRDGRFEEATWKESYIKRNVKKKQMKVRTCDLCLIQFSNYLEVRASYSSNK